jgi:hypothetical protein
LFATGKANDFQTQKWDLGTLAFQKTSFPPGAKRTADQREDRFKPLPEILPTFKAEDIPKTNILHYLFCGLIVSAWLVPMSLVLDYLYFRLMFYSARKLVSALANHTRQCWEAFG